MWSVDLFIRWSTYCYSFLGAPSLNEVLLLLPVLFKRCQETNDEYESLAVYQMTTSDLSWDSPDVIDKIREIPHIVPNTRRQPMAVVAASFLCRQQCVDQKWINEYVNALVSSSCLLGIFSTTYIYATMETINSKAQWIKISQNSYKCRFSTVNLWVIWQK